jgi:cell wall-associated NlpC family hydrolase
LVLRTSDTGGHRVLSGNGVKYRYMRQRSQHLLVAVTVAAVRKRPSHASELLTEAVMGTKLEVLGRSRDSKWQRVRLSGSFVGWMRDWSTVRVSDSGARAWEAGLAVQVRVPCAALKLRPHEQSGAVCYLVLGTRLPVLKTQRSWVMTRLPDQRKGWVRQSLVERIPVTPRRSVHAVKTARLFQGAPYLWGGVTPWGCDCSGLVQMVFAQNGVMLPRDARDQFRALRGSVLKLKGMRLRPGDLLFFGPTKRDITHVAISIGGDAFIHAYGYVREGSIRPGDVRFVPQLARQFRASVRPLGAGKKVIDKKNSFP